MSNEELKYLTTIYRQLDLSIHRFSQQERDEYFRFFDSKMIYLLYARNIANKLTHRRKMFLGTIKYNLGYIAIYENLKKHIDFINQRLPLSNENLAELQIFTAKIYYNLDSKLSL